MRRPVDPFRTLSGDALVFPLATPLEGEAHPLQYYHGELYSFHDEIAGTCTLSSTKVE